MPNRDFIAWLNRGAKTSSPSISDPLSFVNPSRDKKFNKRKKSNEGGQFDWQSTLLKDLPKSMGSNQEKKFDSLAKQSGIPQEEIAGFKTFLDSLEYGAKTHFQHGRASDIAKAKSDGVNAKRVLEQRQRNEQAEAEARRLKEQEQAAMQQRITGFQGRQGLGAGVQGGTQNMPETGIAKTKFFQGLQKAFSGENYRIEPTKEEEEERTTVRLPEGVERFGGRAASSATLGLLEQAERRSLKNNPSEERQRAYDIAFGETDSTGQKVADVVADLVGYLTPGVAGVKAARAAGVGAKGLTKGLSKKNLKELSKEGTIVGGAMGVTEVGIREALNPEDYSALDNLLNVGINAAAGAVLDPLIGLAGPLAKHLSEQMAQGVLSKTALKQLDDAVRSGDYETLSSFLKTDHGPLPQADTSVPKFSDGSVPEPIASPRQATASAQPRTMTAQRSAIDDLLGRGIEEPEALSDDFINQLIAQREQRTAATMTMDEPAFQRQVEENFPTRQEPTESVDLDTFTPVSYDAPAKVAKEKHESWARTLRRQFDSDTNDIKQIEREIVDMDTQGILKINNIGSVVSEDSLNKGVRNLQRTFARAEKSAKTSYDPVLERVYKAGVSKEDFDRYLSAMHYKDIYDNNMDLVSRRGEVLTELERLEALPDADERTVNALVKELDDLEPYVLPEGTSEEWVTHTLQKWADNPTIVQAQKDFISEQKKDLAMRVKSGLYTQAQAEAMIKRHPNYISMRRDIPEEFTGAGSSRSVGRKDIMKRKEGSELKTLSPIDNAYRNRILAYTNAERAEVINRIGKIIKVDGAENYFRQVPEPNANTLTGYENGKPVFYEVPQPLVNLYRNLDKQAENSILKAVQGLATLRKKLTTNLHVGFHIFSGVRDPIQALGNSRTQAHIGDTVLGYLDSFMGKNLEKLSGGAFKSYKDTYMKLGNERSTFISMDKHSLQKMSKALESGKMPDGSSVLNPLNAIEGFGMRVEHGPRLGEFRSAKRKGLSDSDAAFEAADVIDYTDMGSVVRELNKYTPYLNPTLRGNIRTFQGLKENPMRFTTTGLMYVTLPTVANYALRYADTTNDIQRDKINNLQPWQKNLMWAIPVPNTDKIAFMPKPFIFGQLFANPVERTLDNIYSSSDKSTGQILKESGIDLASVLSAPYDVAGLMSAFEVMANYDMFTQMPIESAAMEKEDDKTQRYDAYTSEAAKALGNLTKQSPAKIDHVLKKNLGTLGRDALDVSDNVLSELVDSVPAKVSETKDIINPLKRFSHRDSQSSGVYADIRKQARADDKEWAKHRDMLKDMGIKSPTKQETNAQLALAEWDEYNKEIKELTNNTELTSKEKDKRISAIRDKQRRIGTKFLEN